MFKRLHLDGAYIFCASVVQQSKCLHMSHPYDTFIQTVTWVLGEHPWVLGVTQPAMEYWLLIRLASFE